MARQSGLGKGLGALIPPEVAGKTKGDGPVLRDIPVGDIVPNPNQPRAHFDEESLADLAASIAEVGVLQPVLVRQTGASSYELVAGERDGAGVGVRCGVGHHFDGGLAANADSLRHRRPRGSCHSLPSVCSLPSARATVWKSWSPSWLATS